VTRKKPAPRGAGKPPDRPRVVFRFEDGTEHALTPEQYFAVVTKQQADAALAEASATHGAALGAEQAAAQIASDRRNQSREAATAPRPKARKHDPDELRAEFDRLVAKGHTPAEARGIMVRGGDASQSTIHRATTKKVSR